MKTTLHGEESTEPRLKLANPYPAATVIAAGWLIGAAEKGPANAAGPDVVHAAFAKEE